MKLAKRAYAALTLGAAIELRDEAANPCNIDRNDPSAAQAGDGSSVCAGGCRASSSPTSDSSGSSRSKNLAVVDRDSLWTVMYLSCWGLN